MQTFTKEEITKIQEVREIVDSICGATTCGECPLYGWSGCEEGTLLRVLDNIISYAEKNKGGN